MLDTETGYCCIMNETNSFYMTLTSDSSIKENEGNKTSSFTVNLAKNISLDGDWNVALVEALFPFTIENVTPMNNCFIYEFKKVSKESTQIMNERIEIPIGHYRDIADLIRMVNFSIKNYDNSLVDDMFEISQVTGKVHCNQQVRDLFVQKINAKNGTWTDDNMIIPHRLYFQPLIALMMGHNPFNHDLMKNVDSIHLPSIKLGLPSEMLIYMDIITPIILGNR